MDQDLDLAADLSVLQSHLDGVLDSAKHNSLTLRRFHLFETKLLGMNSLNEIIEHIFNDLKVLFDLDVISFCLIDEHGDLEKHLEEEGFQGKEKSELIFHQDNNLLGTTFGYAIRPYLGAYKRSKCSSFFPDLDKKPASVAIIPLCRRGKYFGSLNLGSFNPNRFVESMATDFIEHMASVICICLENSINVELLRRNTVIDSLTGINNRSFLNQRIREEIHRALRNDEPLSCCCINIDGMKSINNDYGHQMGDKVMAEVAAMIQEQLRTNDVLARNGGDEFFVLFSGIEKINAALIAERIRKAINDLVIEEEGNIIQFTVSIGVSTLIPAIGSFSDAGEIASRLVQSADEALLKAKHSGKDCVIIGDAVSADSARSNFTI